MRPDTILKITEIWLNCDVDIQTELISKFLNQLDHGVYDDWVDFLVDELLLMNFFTR